MDSFDEKVLMGTIPDFLKRSKTHAQATEVDVNDSSDAAYAIPFGNHDAPTDDSGSPAPLHFDLDGLATSIKKHMAEGRECLRLANAQIQEAFRRIEAGEGNTTRDDWCDRHFGVTPGELLERTRSVFEAKLDEVAAKRTVAGGISEARPKNSSHPRAAIEGGPSRGRPPGKTVRTMAAEMAGDDLGVTAQTVQRRLKRSDGPQALTIQRALNFWGRLRQAYPRWSEVDRAKFDRIVHEQPLRPSTIAAEQGASDEARADNDGE